MKLAESNLSYSNLKEHDLEKDIILIKEGNQENIKGELWLNKFLLFFVTNLASSMLLFSIIAGSLGGFIQILPQTDNPTQLPWFRLSAIVGWIYFFAWSVSFYPNVILYYQRKSVIGLSFDYVLLNLIGYFCYSIYNLCLFYNIYIQEQYFELYKSNNGVHFNDVLFPIHGLLITIIIIIQILIYERGDQMVSIIGCIIAILLLSFICIYAIAALIAQSNYTSWLSWLSFVETLANIKLVISMIKYLPQVYLHYKRKKTSGWNIAGCILDFTGGVLSITQQLIDAILLNDFTIVYGDPVKFGLGLLSICFDLVFMMQHFILYKNNNNV